MPNWPTLVQAHLYIMLKHTTYIETYTMRSTIHSTIPLLKDERKAKKYEERMVEICASRICWPLSQNIHHSPSNVKAKFATNDVFQRCILKHLHHNHYILTLKRTELIITTSSMLRSSK